MRERDGEKSGASRPRLCTLSLASFSFSWAARCTYPPVTAAFFLPSASSVFFFSRRRWWEPVLRYKCRTLDVKAIRAKKACVMQVALTSSSQCDADVESHQRGDRLVCVCVCGCVCSASSHYATEHTLVPPERLPTWCTSEEWWYQHETCCPIPFFNRFSPSKTNKT